MRRREIPGGVRFLTFSCQRRLPLFSNPSIAELMASALATARTAGAIELFAWVIMPEHVHVLCRPSASRPLESTLQSMKISVARRVLDRWKVLRSPVLERVRDATGRPRFWQKGGGFDRNVRDESEFRREVRYIHMNPFERGLVKHPEEWRWSSVRWWMGTRDGEIECNPPPGHEESMRRWKGFV